MTYKDALDFLFSSLPMYQRTGAAAYKANLDNTLAFDEYFNHPHRRFRSIHIAGTNGKGSVSHMLASVLQAAGYRTGLYTSPHLLDFRERIRINGTPVPEAFVTRFVEDHRDMIRKISPSFFEMTVAMAFDYFARSHVDIAVIETGMGGRLDSTNIITPLVSVITNISMDHTAFLGDTPALIAKEKAGIIKQGVPVVVGESDPQTDPVFLSVASSLEASLTFASEEYQLQYSTLGIDQRRIWRYKARNGEAFQVSTDLTGDYQEMNLKTVFTTLGILKGMGVAVTPEQLASGLKQVVPSTGLRGRWETLGANPRILCDTGHNEAGIRNVFRQLGMIPFRQLHVVWGMVNDKDISHILPLLPASARWYFTRASVPRALDPVVLRDKAKAFGLQGAVYDTVKDAVEAARREALPDDLIFIGGSTFVVADALPLFGEEEDRSGEKIG
ncbi:MAG: bifunctional folylpolyglutamate synthase/dihydrofolate synthase [Bacteroidota bacterium]